MKTPTKSEIATVLAALRYFQANHDAVGGEKGEGGEHFADCKPLTSEEIDNLCERINLGEWPAKIDRKKGRADRKDAQELRFFLQKCKIMGFGTEEPINGGDCVDLINEHFFNKE